MKHLNFIRAFTNLMVVAMENERLALGRCSAERLARELELAAEVQGHAHPHQAAVGRALRGRCWYLPTGWWAGITTT